MQDLTKNYIKWISDFTKEQFDEVVFEYIKSVWKIDDLVITDGTNDGGNDIRIFENNRKLKIQIQVTVQETSIDGKITKELANAKNNLDKYGYQNKFFFFYSYPMSEEKINDFQLVASDNYDIDIDIIDAKRIAWATKKYPDLLNCIHRQYGIPNEGAKVLTEEDKMLYDFISFGSNTTEIKGQIVKSFIIHKVYEANSMTQENLVQCCSQHFSNGESPYTNKVIQQLRADKILIFEKESAQFKLSDTEVKRIDTLKSQFSFQEQKILNDIREQLIKFKVDPELGLQVIENLRTLFESNFDIDKQEILDRAYSLNEDDKIKSFTKLFYYLKKITNGSNEKAKLLAKKLLEICKNNDILQRLSAGKLFTSFSDPDVVRNYINQTERVIFLDTQIVLYALCIYFERTNYQNHFYQAVSDLLNLNDKHSGIKFKVYNRYLNEVGYHLKEALLLVPFEEYGLLEGLGGTNNVFFSYYQYLKDSQLLEEEITSFADFLNIGFELNEKDAFHRRYFDITEGIVRERLQSIGIEVYDDEEYSKDNFDEIKRAINSCLLSRDRNRPEATINNDANMISILFDEALSINEPILISWDQTLFCARKKYFDTFRTSRLWHWFTPDQFVSHISLLNFNISSTTITRDILSLFDDSFNLYKRTHQLLDTISKLVNVRSETGRKYVEKIKEFKRNYIFDVDGETPTSLESVEEKTYPIESVIVSLTKHYIFNKEQYTIEDFKAVFSIDLLFEKVVSYFQNEVNFYMQNRQTSQDYIPKMDEIIKESKIIISNESAS